MQALNFFDGSLALYRVFPACCMAKKRCGLDVVIPKTDTRAGPGIDSLRASMDKEVPPRAAYNADKEKHGREC